MPAHTKWRMHMATAYTKTAQPTHKQNITAKMTTAALVSTRSKKKRTVEDP